MMPPNEPLSNEERHLAAQLDHVLPRGVPSPDLDARILAASRAALEPTAAPAKPRWPVALALAASMVVAVGLAWQLRLPDQVAMVASEAPPLEQAPAAAQDASRAFPSASQAVSPASPPVPVAANADDATANSGPAMPAESGGREARVEGPPAAGTTRREIPAPAGRPAPAPAAPQDRAGPPPPAPPPAPAAPAPMRQLAPASVRPGASPFVADPEQGGSRQSGAFMPDRPIGMAEAQAGSNGTVAERYQALSRTQVQRAAAAESTADSQTGAGAALDRIEVSGSRVRRTDLQVPVSADAFLDEDEWIERIRTRQGIGDEDSARRSLALFVQAHSRARVPADLLPLLAK